MPDINFDCPHCGQNLDAPEDLAGVEIECPACSKTVAIPGREGVEADAMPEDLQKGSTMRLEVPKDLAPPPPRRRIVKIKRLQK